MTILLKLFVTLAVIAIAVLSITVPGITLIVVFEGAKLCLLWVAINIIVKIIFGRSITDMLKNDN